ACELAARKRPADRDGTAPVHSGSGRGRRREGGCIGEGEVAGRVDRGNSPVGEGRGGAGEQRTQHEKERPAAAAPADAPIAGVARVHRCTVRVTGMSNDTPWQLLSE